MAICRNCRWCKITPVPNTPSCFMECKLHYKVEPLTGDKIYEDCSEHNADGKCSGWEQGGIIGFITRNL